MLRVLGIIGKYVYHGVLCSKKIHALEKSEGM